MGLVKKEGYFLGDNQWNIALMRHIKQNKYDVLHKQYEGKSGTIASCSSYKYLGNKENLSMSDIKQEIQKIEHMHNPQESVGYIMRVGVDHYDIYRTNFPIITKINGISCKRIFENMSSYINKRGNYVLGYAHNLNHNPTYGRLDMDRYLAVGNLMELKDKAKQILEANHYIEPMYIISKSKAWKCTAEIRTVYESKAESNNVIPIYKYMYIGWCTCI